MWFGDRFLVLSLLAWFHPYLWPRRTEQPGINTVVLNYFFTHADSAPAGCQNNETETGLMIPRSLYLLGGSHLSRIGTSLACRDHRIKDARVFLME